MARRVSGEDFAAEVLERQGLTIVDFYQDGCVPCKRLLPLLAELEEEYDQSLSVVKVNAIYDMELSLTHQIAATPTLLIFHQGKEVGRLQGVPKREEITNILDRYR